MEKNSNQPLNQAERYQYLIGLTEGKQLDADYRAAFYILSSVPECSKQLQSAWTMKESRLIRSRDFARENWKKVRCTFYPLHIMSLHGTAGQALHHTNFPD